MKEIFLFSGLGADERAFGKLDFSGYKIAFIQWINPDKGESIENYAKRLSSQVTSENPILIGLSFGGIMAAEVAKYTGAEKIILIASAKTKKEIPFYYKFAGYLYLHKIIPAKLLKGANFMSYWFFGTESKSDKELLKSILSDTDSKFLKWALDKIINWQNSVKNDRTIHIHGSADRILPIRYMKTDVVVKKGGHFMTINKHKQLSLEIRKILND
jgi:pimeloyl-ACP methyl ester carboxylesterase